MLTDRQVQTQPLPQGLDRLCRRNITEDGIGRITRQGAHGEENHRQHRKYRRNGKQKTARNEECRRVARRQLSQSHISSAPTFSF